MGHVYELAEKDLDFEIKSGNFTQFHLHVNLI